MSGYKYRGTIHDVEEVTVPRPRKVGEFDPSACGTYAGYRRHQKHGVPTCEDCKTAMAAYSRDRYQPRPPKEFTTELCGTWAGRRRHDYYDVPPCEACRAAAREYQRKWRATRKHKTTSPHHPKAA